MNRELILLSLGMITVIIGTVIAFKLDNFNTLRGVLIYFVGLFTGLVSTVLIVLAALSKH